MWKFLILREFSMRAIVSFGSWSVMLIGGGLAPFADTGESAWSSAWWLEGRPLCVWLFSGIVGCGVVFFVGAAGEVLVRATLFLFVVIGDVTRGVGCLLAFFLSKSVFFYVFDDSFLWLRCAGILSL